MAKKNRSSHDRVRASLARSFASADPRLVSCADSFALGIHPWPDEKLSDEAREALIGELNPWSNAPHPDAREVIADRLLRLAEVARDHDPHGDWAPQYESAARRLTDALVADGGPVPDPFGLATDPYGLANVGHFAEETLVPTPSLGTRPRSVGLEETVRVVGRVLMAVCQSGSLDLGVTFGQEHLGTPLDFIIRATDLPDLLQDMDEWFENVDPRRRELLKDRVFASTRSRTLESMGAQWGLTRERIRQIETKAKDEFMAEFRRRLTELAGLLDPLKWNVLLTRRFVEAVRLLGSSLKHGDEVTAAIVWNAGPWQRDDEWTFHSSLRSRLKDVTESVRASADEYGLLADGGLASFGELFFSQADCSRYLGEVVGLVSMSGFWGLRDSKRSRVAAALKRIGRPATKLQIGEEAGIPDEARIGSFLSALPNIVRADKERWAFSDWVDDAYEGIVGEIDQRIDAGSGSASVASLMFELPRRFKVSENSVALYLQTPAFVVEGGLVRRAEAGEFEASPPGKWPDAYWRDGMWGQRLRVEQRHFEGYSLRVRFDIAYANGLRPDCDLKVALDSDGTLVSVIWRAHDAAWLIDVGRISDVLVARGYEVGEALLVSPGPDLVRVERWDDVEETNAENVPIDYSEFDDPLFGLLGNP